MSSLSTEDYRRIRRSALTNTFMLPLLVYLPMSMFESMLTDALATQEGGAAVIATVMGLLNFIVVIGVPIGMLIAAWAHIQIASNAGGRGRRSSPSRERETAEVDVDVGGLLAALNAKLPSLTFGTYRRVEEERAGARETCVACGDDADVSRTYSDSTVRFGLAFGATEPQSVSYCAGCADADDAVREGWSPAPVENAT